MDNALGSYNVIITWHPTAIRKPDKNGSYLCWVAVYDYEDGKKVVSWHEHDIKTYDDGEWWNGRVYPDGCEVVAWAELPKCAFYLNEVKV